MAASGGEEHGGSNVIHAVCLPYWLWECLMITFLLADGAYTGRAFATLMISCKVF